MKQPALFGNNAPPASPAPRAEIEFFNFERGGDATRCVPQPGAVISEEIRLPTDDEAG